MMPTTELSAKYNECVLQQSNTILNIKRKGANVCLLPFHVYILYHRHHATIWNIKYIKYTSYLFYI